MIFTMISFSKNKRIVHYKVIERQRWYNPLTWGYHPLWWGEMPIDDFLNLLEEAGTYVVVEIKG